MLSSSILFHLREVLDSLQQVGLTANLKKCHLGLTEAQYLGYCISRGLLKPQEKKLDGTPGPHLSKTFNGEEHPVLNVSRKLTHAERKYAIVEREALAIKWAIEELQYYLAGRHFTLVTNARVTHWFLSTQDFSFQVQHLAGAQHGNADVLTRSKSAHGCKAGWQKHTRLAAGDWSGFFSSSGRRAADIKGHSRRGMVSSFSLNMGSDLSLSFSVDYKRG